MTEEEFELIKKKVLIKLKGLDPRLTYHGIMHTTDVIEQSLRIARSEGITAERELMLLKVAALYHDVGFLKVYTGHEKQGCKIFLEDAADFNLTSEEKDRICNLILATKVPQQPKTLQEKIICDADLDYLGREDFPEIAERLRKEFLACDIVHDIAEWKKMQLAFVEGHQYHTESSRKLRAPVQKINYEKLK